jgi:hypothetical protein
VTLSVSLRPVAGRNQAIVRPFPMALKLRRFSQRTILSVEKITMRSLVVAIGLGAGLLLFSGQAHAQYKYTDDKGVTRTAQYKLDIPEPYRDAAEWVGPTGIGKPGLSLEQQQAKQREDAYRRIGVANEGLKAYGGSSLDTPARSSGPSRVGPKAPSSSGSREPEPEKVGQDAPVMCISGERRVMTSPGHWEIQGGCHSGFSAR